MTVVKASGLVKTYGDVRALDGFDMAVEPGQIVGLIGPNGSGKTTALNAMLGLNQLNDGDLSVLGKQPMTERAAMMSEVAYIADTGILPRWMKVNDLLSYVADVHPKFNLEAAKARLERTEIRSNKRVAVLSKGMHVQLHLAIVLAIDAPLLVLDEPTLGLDIIYRQQFYEPFINSRALELAFRHFLGRGLSCMDEFQTYFDLVVTSIYEAPELNLSLDIYPNPTVGRLTMEGDWNNGDRVMMTDLNGRPLIEQELPPEREDFDMSGYPAGTYLLTVTRDRRPLKSFRVIKQ